MRKHHYSSSSGHIQVEPTTLFVVVYKLRLGLPYVLSVAVYFSSPTLEPLAVMFALRYHMLLLGRYGPPGFHAFSRSEICI